MIVNSLTVWDVAGCLRGVAAFAPVLLAPGYCLAWVLDLLGFRSRPLGEQLAWAIALSFGVVTIVAVELAKAASLSAVCWLCGVCMVAMLGISAVQFRRRERGAVSRWGWIGALLAAVWAVLAVLELVDIGMGSHLLLSVTIYDHALRTAFVDAVMRTGVPPANPLYWPGHAAPMRYYYFWYVVTAAAARIGAVTARQAMIASVAWSGFGLAAVMALYCRHFLGAGSALDRDAAGRRWPRLALALGLLTVTGLDLLPAIAKFLFRVPTDADMEWWSPDQVASWLDSLLWVPHHIAGLVCCLFGFLLVWMAKGRSGRQRGVGGAIAGLSFASAFGLSTWVAVAFALVLLAWLAWALGWERESRARVPVLLGAGLVAVLTLMPYLAELRASSAGGGTNAPVAGSVTGDASHLLRFGVRHMIDPECLLGVPWFAALSQARPRVEDAVAGLILLLPGYFVELGVYGLVLVVALRAWRRRELDEATRTALVLVCAGLMVSSVLRSTVISNNDFGIRSILIPQFFLLLLAVLWCEGTFGPPRGVLRAVALAMLWIGVAGSAYQAVGLRLYLPMEERLARPDEAGLATRAMAWRTGFQAMDLSIPKDAVIQFNTAEPSDMFRFAQMIEAGRQMATSFPDCDASFGGSPAACGGITGGVKRLFAAERPLTADQARGECAALGIGYLVATRWDGVWTEESGWVWSLPAVVNTGDVRVVDCGAQGSDGE